MIEIFIAPVAKPRQTRSDVWKKRPCVLKYRKFADELRLKFKVLNVGLSDRLDCIFVIQMPKSWSKKKKSLMKNKHHRQRPDIDNISKSVLDSLCKDDSHIHTLNVKKVWGETGKIIFRNLEDLNKLNKLNKG